MNTRSQNFYAEQVFKAISAVKSGRGSWEESARLVTLWARKAGIPAGELTISDGSGMSRENRASAGALTALLARAHAASYAKTIRESLASPGEGTLRSRLTGEPYRDRIRAKSGYLRGVGALSGYARTRSGRDIAFSFIINGYRGGGAVKGSLDALVRATVDTF
jgi:D-alanyl-D-alanine carboxypeptidase/D-alanyl-D-alanine-endopeptidase (penicillin-binding protein 4)